MFEEETTDPIAEVNSKAEALMLEVWNLSLTYPGQFQGKAH